MLYKSETGRGPRTVLVHGFTQTHTSWKAVTNRVAGRRFVAVDLPGHGLSSEERARDIEDAARMIASAGGEADYVGYSMGARICLRLAIDSPELVRSLILIAGTAGIEDPDERAQRQQEDLKLADRAVHTDLEQFLREWIAQPMFAGLDASQIRERLVNTPEGLASAIRTLGTGSMLPLWDRLPGLAVPTLVIWGAGDLKFREIGKRMASMIPGSRAAEIPGSGHAAILEQPGVVARTAREFWS